jgi:hypothetical protein
LSSGCGKWPRKKRSEAVPIHTCPQCEGERKVPVFGIVYAPGHKGRPGRLIKCPFCEGAGEVSERRLKWLHRGQAYREKRIAEGVGLRQRAEQLGILPSRLSGIEHGRFDPSEIGA